VKNKTLNCYLGLPYKIELKFEPEDSSWMATHPELGRDSCYAIGDTQEEALKRLEEEKRFVLEILIKRGIEIPEPKSEEDNLPSGQFVVRIPRTIHQKIKDISEKEKVSLNQYVVSVLSEKVGEKFVLYKAENAPNKGRLLTNKKFTAKKLNKKRIGKAKAKSSKLRNL